MSENLCHCGKPLHYVNKHIQKMVEDLVTELGEFIPVTIKGRTWLVQRHYIALHGLKGKDLPKLGFKEITGINIGEPHVDTRQ